MGSMRASSVSSKQETSSRGAPIQLEEEVWALLASWRAGGLQVERLGECGALSLGSTGKTVSIQSRLTGPSETIQVQEQPARDKLRGGQLQEEPLKRLQSGAQQTADSLRDSLHQAINRQTVTSSSSHQHDQVSPSSFEIYRKKKHHFRFAFGTSGCL